MELCSLPVIYLAPNYGGGDEDNGGLLQKILSVACTASLRAPNPAADHHWPTPQVETPGHSQASLGQPLLGSLLLSPGSWCTRICLCPPRVYFPLLCKFWQLCGGINGDLLLLISFRIDLFDLLAIQGILKSFLQHHSSKELILQHWAFFFTVQNPLDVVIYLIWKRYIIFVTVYLRWIRWTKFLFFAKCW